MLQLVKLKRTGFMRPVLRFLYYAATATAFLACAAMYILNFVQVWGLPTGPIHSPLVVEASPLGQADLSSDSIEEEEASSKEEIPVNLYGNVVVPPPEIYGNIRTAYEENSDTVGWITVPGSNMDYPVLQTEDNETYLRRDLQKRYRFTGSIFADYRDQMGDRNTLSQNTVIYGHNINVFNESIGGEMFAQLLGYADLDFAAGHQYIVFSTEKDSMTWEVFAAFYTDLNFNYNNVSPSSPEVFQAILSEARARSEISFGVVPGVNDKILTLSTCSYKYSTAEGQRFAVMARLVEGESLPQKTLQINANPKQPDFVTQKKGN